VQNALSNGQIARSNTEITNKDYSRERAREKFFSWVGIEAGESLCYPWQAGAGTGYFRTPI
jgi:hypothetical protein